MNGAPLRLCPSPTPTANLAPAMAIQGSPLFALSLGVICVGLLGHCHAAIPSLPPAEQAVVDALLGDREGVLRTREVAVLEIASAPDLEFSGTYSNAQKQTRLETSRRGLPLAQALQDVMKKGRTATRIAQIANAQRPVHLVREDTFRNILSESDNSFDEYASFCERFPNCDRFITLSRVGFDAQGSLAVVCYSVKGPSRADIDGFQVLRRADNQWFITECRKVMRQEPLNLVDVTCKLRYYVTPVLSEGEHFPKPLSLQVLRNNGTNLVCAVAGAKLTGSLSGPSDFMGWVLQVTELAEYAGQLLTAELDDYPRTPLFRPGRLYDIAVPKNRIGDRDFKLRF